MMEKPYSLFHLSSNIVSQLLWGNFCSDFCLEKPEFALVSHREEIERKISYLPTTVSSLLKQGLLVLEKAYNDAFHWLDIYKIKIQSLRSNELDVIRDEQYNFKNFLTPVGEFNDEKWVLKFVDDERQNIFDRFYLACFYCLEEKLPSLWHDNRIKESYLKGTLYVSTQDIDPMLVKLWIHYLDRNQTEFRDTGQFKNLLDYGVGFAVDGGDEKAVRYFVNRMSDRLTLRHRFIYEISRDKIIKKGYRKIHKFLWSILSPGIKKDLLRTDFHRQGHSSIWNFYIQPWLISFIPEEIAQHQDVLPPSAYRIFLKFLAAKIREIRSPIYQAVFMKVWKIGSKANKIDFLQNDVEILLNLFHAKDFTSARFVLKDASLDQKKRILFETIEKTLSTYALQNDQCVRNYLLLFLLDLTQETAETFHADSLSLLEETVQKIQGSDLDPNFKTSSVKEIENLSSEIETCSLNDLQQETDKNVQKIENYNGKSPP